MKLRLECNGSPQRPEDIKKFAIRLEPFSSYWLCSTKATHRFRFANVDSVPSLVDFVCWTSVKYKGEPTLAVNLHTQQHFHFELSQVFLKMSKLLGLILIARNGDRLELPHDPSTYQSNVPSSTTAVGEYNSWKLGESIRRMYIGSAHPNEASFEDYDPATTVDFPPYDPSAEFDWGTMEEPATLHDPRQIHVSVKAGVEGTVVFDSAIALLQGMYPPTAKNGVVLANGTWVQAPLGGYQYVPGKF